MRPRWTRRWTTDDADARAALLWTKAPLPRPHSQSYPPSHTRLWLGKRRLYTVSTTPTTTMSYTFTQKSRSSSVWGQGHPSSAKSHVRAQSKPPSRRQSDEVPG